jgi:hypothetical protein
VICGFRQRESKLSPAVFFELLFYCASRMDNSSLSFMVSYLESRYGISIAKQSLDERFNQRCVCFVQAILVEVLQDKWQNIYDPELLAAFNQVRIKDSTRFNLPPNMAPHYRGSGGNKTTSPAGISIQYEYDIKSGRILTMDFTPAVRNDQRDALETASNVSQSDLVIRDSGYFSTAVLETVSPQQAFFLSRLPRFISVYGVNERLCFKKVYTPMQRGGITQMELPVWVGRERKIPVRLILRLVPNQVCEKRIRDKEKENRKKGKGRLSGETRIRLRFNLFITNATEQDLPAEYVFPLYRLRRQIELMFKVWKSVFKIERIQKMKEERYISLLLAKMLLTVIHLQITWRIQKTLSRMDSGKLPVPSLNKALKTLSTLFNQLFEMLRAPGAKACAIARAIQERLSKNHCLEKKKNKLSFPEIMQLFICKPEQ